MKKTTINSKGLRVLITLSLVFVVISILLMLYNAIAYLDFEGLLAKPEIYGLIVALNAIFIFFTHILFIITIIITISSIKKYRWFSMGVLLFGILSLISIFGHYGCLTDIAKELPMGLEVQGEINAIYFAMFLHFLFFFLFFVYLLKVRKYLRHNKLQQSTQMSENMYIIMHIVGAICGGLGIVKIAGETIIINNLMISPLKRLWFVLPSTIVQTLPYLLVAAGWVFHTFHGRKAGQIDEKQITDMYHAGFTTWLVSIPFMFLLYIFNYHNIHGLVSIFWLPIYFFSTLFIFSLSSLYYFRNGNFSFRVKE